jgi:hypothetical protein
MTEYRLDGLSVRPFPYEETRQAVPQTAATRVVGYGMLHLRARLSMDQLAAVK